MARTDQFRRRMFLAAAAGTALVPAFGSAVYAANQAPKVYIDPGHGGSEPGAVGNGLVEKDLTLDIALQTRDILQNGWSVDVRMSRTGDDTVSLDARTSDANSWGAALFVSIHINAGGGTGYEDFRYPTAGEETARIHGILHDHVLQGMRSVSSITDRGEKTANFHVLRETVMPAILTENLFIDTAADAGLLADPAFITATAQGHADGIAAALGL